MFFYAHVDIFVHTCRQKCLARAGKNIDSCTTRAKALGKSIEIVNDSDASVQRLEWRLRLVAKVAGEDTITLQS